MRVTSVKPAQKIVLKKPVEKKVITEDMKKVLNPKLPDNTPIGTYRFNTPWGSK